jgi:hypothetical protein
MIPDRADAHHRGQRPHGLVWIISVRRTEIRRLSTVPGDILTLMLSKYLRKVKT